MPTSLVVVDLEGGEEAEAEADDRQDKAWMDESRRTGCETATSASRTTSSGGMPVACGVVWLSA